MFRSLLSLLLSSETLFEILFLASHKQFLVLICGLFQRLRADLYPTNNGLDGSFQSFHTNRQVPASITATQSPPPENPQPPLAIAHLRRINGVDECCKPRSLPGKQIAS